MQCSFCVVLSVFEGSCCRLVVCLQSPVCCLWSRIPYLSTYTFIFIVYVCLYVIVCYLGVSSCVLVHCMCHISLVDVQVSV